MVERRKFPLLPRDLGALLGDQRREVAGHVVAMTGGAQPGQSPGGAEVEAQSPQPGDKSEPTEIVLGVYAVAVRAAARLRQHPFSLVEANRGWCDPYLTGDVGHVHDTDPTP
jgi:hypothetical protein